MISFEEAYQKVLAHPMRFGTETIALMQSTGRILAEDVRADRDFPPFNRATKDGIAIRFSAIEKGIQRYKIQGTLSAGRAQQILSPEENCFEIMTGAVLPENADTIVMYEETHIENGWATISNPPKKGQNIHAQGSDSKAGVLLLEKGTKVTPSVIGVLASVGKTEIAVKRLPKVCVISTGNELVEISATPLPHQIRKSNTLSLAAALEKSKILPTHIHLDDDREIIEKNLQKAIAGHDVLLLSGGVSKGKFDFIPDALEALGVQKVFHRVAQRPGKPFWFGTVNDPPINNLPGDNQQPGNQKQENRNQENPGQKNPGQENQKQNRPQHGNMAKVIFSFPGNPVSTFANYHIYFLPWLATSLGIGVERRSVILDEPVRPHPNLTLFLQVKMQWRQGRLYAKLVQGNGSGDLVGLAKADGLICVPCREPEISEGEIVPVIPFN